MKINKKIAACAAALIMCANVHGAVNGYMYQKKDTTKTVKKEKDVKKDDKAKQKKKNEYEELVKKGGTVKKGLFTVRHIADKWYFEIPDSLLGRYLLCVTRYTGVPQNFGKFSGEMVNEATVYFEKRDYKTMLLRAYVLSQTAKGEDKIAKTLNASTIDPMVASFKIISGHKDKHMSVVDVTNLFLKDNNLMSGTKSSLTTQKLAGLMSDRTFIDTMKVFPINIEVGTTRTYGSASGKAPAGATGSVTLGMNTSIVMLPKEPMRKRLWDKRVGYFVNNFTLFSDEQHKTQRESFIARYNLVPKDVKKYMRGELVEPVKQIVYYIDPATPKQWVPYLIKGVEDWNTAFEAAGFKNAIAAKPWPKDANMSVDDARFSMIRYLPAELENAYGPHISDPRSGEIIESHVCWYHNVMNLLTKWYMIQCGPLDKRAQTMDFDEKLMGELIRFVSSHEIGHSLGLRHNMGASSLTPVEKLRDKAWVEKYGHTASIMDYARFNYVAQPEDKIGEKGLFPRINDYDKWAIKWGYSYRPEFKDEFEEKKAMMTETTKILAANPRYWFAGEGRDESPLSQTEDLGDNNMKANEYGMKNLKRVMANLPKWTYQENDVTDNLWNMHKAVREQYHRYWRHVLKNVGGRWLSNMPGKKPSQVAPAARQKEAIAFLGRNVFDTPLWLYPQNISDKTGYIANNDIITQQNIALSSLLSANTLTKIYDDSFTSTDAYQLPDYLNDIFKEVWKPLSQTDELKNKYRRSLERKYLSHINSHLNPIKVVSTSPTDKLLKIVDPKDKGDVNLYLIEHLNAIENFAKAQLAKSNGVNALHYKDILREIKLINERFTTAK